PLEDLLLIHLGQARLFRFLRRLLVQTHAFLGLGFGFGFGWLLGIGLDLLLGLLLGLRRLGFFTGRHFGLLFQTNRRFGLIQGIARRRVGQGPSSQRHDSREQNGRQGPFHGFSPSPSPGRVYSSIRSATSCCSLRRVISCVFCSS